MPEDPRHIIPDLSPELVEGWDILFPFARGQVPENRKDDESQ